MKIHILSSLSFLLFVCCSPAEVAKPRPHQYPRIVFPADEFKVAKLDYCPFIMDIPSYAHIVQKAEVAGEEAKHACWFDIRMDSFGSTVHCSYYPIEAENSREKLIEDAYEMASKHNVMADYREEYEMVTQHGNTGLIFKIEGPVATPYQFYISDDKNHFFRGSLYFDTRIDVDSMAPIVEYIERDIQKMLSSLQWK